MSLGKILSNLGTGISGQASKLRVDKEGMSMIQKKHYDKAIKQVYGGDESKMTPLEAKNVQRVSKASSSIQGYFKGLDQVAGKGYSIDEAKKVARSAALVRGGAAVGAYGAAAVGTRMISGGGIGYNNSGERDIAGIPFI